MRSIIATATEARPEATPARSFARFRLRALVMITAMAALSVALISTPGSAEFDLLKTEHFGKLRQGLSQSAVLAYLGRPSSKSKEALEAASGEYFETWSYPSRGISLDLAGPKKGGPKSISRMSLKAPCQLASARGIHIGSTDAEVRKAYAKELDKENTRQDSIVAGSIYGGIIFSMSKGRVTGIFLGAAAE